MSDGVRRVVRPKRRYMTSMKEQKEAWSRLLSKIDGFYKEASHRLCLEAKPITPARFLDAGICIGLLDPVSNIMINAICTSDLRPRRRAKIFSVDAVDDKKLEELGRRSLEGLVAFLLYFFPYIARWEALHYLLLADADLLAAARFIVADRGMSRFSLASAVAAPAFEEALTLAAKIAKYSQPKHLAHVWMLLSSRLHEVILLLYEAQHDSRHQHQHLQTLKLMLKDPAVSYLDVSWDLAANRLLNYSSCFTSMPNQHTRSMRMVLLDTIHGFYLKALVILPQGELRSRLHRSLLRAGYCYGPLDPVSNIILNTIWYDSNFPAAETPVLDVIGPNSLTRLESRSFYGLVSFLQTRYHDLSEHQIVQCLVAASAQLSIADPKLLSGTNALEAEQSLVQHEHCLKCMLNLCDDGIKKMVQKIPSANVQEAYAAAATAAWHPNPEDQAKFLASWADPRVFSDGHPISSAGVEQLSLLLSEDKKRTPERICNPIYPVIAGKARSMNQQSRISRKVKDALDRHLLQHGKPAFDLHIICCVNEYVCGPEYCDDIDDPLAFAPCKYRYTHVNFLATLRGSVSDDIPYPILFFAEFDNEMKDSAPLLCQVDQPTPFTEHVRCLYCEAEGAKVVHPPSLKFHGGGSDLEEYVCGKHPLSNGFLICKNEHAVQLLCEVEEDFMYVHVS